MLSTWLMARPGLICAPWSRCHRCGTRALSVPGCCKSLLCRFGSRFQVLQTFQGEEELFAPSKMLQPLEKMQSLCMKWMFWGGLCWLPPAQCPPDRCDREQGRSGWMAEVAAAASWSVGICSWNIWLGGGAVPAPSRCAGRDLRAPGGSTH